MSEKFYLADTRPIDHDNSVDLGIRDCLRLGEGKSFITFAGAGSGKTYSLKEALEFIKEQYFEHFTRQGKQVAVVTFTNNAADEITDRIEQNSMFSVSTIHSFCWSAIDGFNEDIRKWYLETIPFEIEELQNKERTGRAGAASDARKRTIIRLNEKMLWLEESRTFIYDPNSVNSYPNALSHADVLKIFSHFLTHKPMMSEVIVNRYPFICIDESQDTNKGVIHAFLKLQNDKPNSVTIGLFGDTMQRIFGGGDPDLGETELLGWTTFNKEMNHRSARRIVGLANRIREGYDKRKQYARDTAIEGYVRYFLVPHGISGKEKVEAEIRETMAKFTDDSDWTNIKSEETAILLLEHKMAGHRLGFDVLWDCLSESDKVKNRISEGANTELNFFSNTVLPLVEASLNERQAELISILREAKSPLLKTSVLGNNKDDPLAPARAAEHEFRAVITNETVTFRQVLSVLAEYKLLRIPLKLQSFIAGAIDSDTESKPAKSDAVINTAEESEHLDDSEISAWSKALETDFFQIRNYKKYTDENSPFRTHQGVKGNEFERVMVVMDDNNAGGFLFSYEQYFGVKELSTASQKKQKNGEETGLDRTRRLFYVTSTRAKNSLAHVIYTSDLAKVRKNLIEQKFAQKDEIIEVNDQLIA